VKEAWLLVRLALSGIWILKWFGVIDRLMGVRTIDARGADELVQGGALMLDVRSGEEFAAARIPASRHIPLSEVGTRLSELEAFREQPIVVSCRSGSRSARACSLLRKNGFEAYSLRGGLLAWARSGRRIDN